MTESQIDSIAGYLSTFNTGEQLYNSMCSRCHGPNGNGQGLAHEAVQGESAGDITEAIQEEQVMRFLSCLPADHPDAINKIADFLGGQQQGEGDGEKEHAGEEHQIGENTEQRYMSRGRHEHQSRQQVHRAGYRDRH